MPVNEDSNHLPQGQKMAAVTNGVHPPAPTNSTTETLRVRLCAARVKN
jgi:hypothetical protein